MDVILQMGVSGALMGLVYALIAYGFQLTFATSKSINFGQGELVMLSAFISLTLLNLGLPYWLMVPAGLVVRRVARAGGGAAGGASRAGTEERRLDIDDHHRRPVRFFCGREYLGQG